MLLYRHLLQIFLLNSSSSEVGVQNINVIACSAAAVVIENGFLKKSVIRNAPRQEKKHLLRYNA